MTQQKTAIISLLALIFPLLVLGGLWIKTTLDRDHGGQIWQIKMAGYDPRDLLYGHYLRFRYDWNLVQNPKIISSEEASCLCLNRAADGTTKNPTATPIKCQTTTKICESVIKVFNHRGRYTRNPSELSEKYFIPEEKATMIDQVFRQNNDSFYMELMVHKNQSSAVRGLYIEDEPLETYLRRKEQSIKDSAQ